MTASPFTGVGTALLTPFREDGAVDLANLTDFIEFQINEGINFIVPCGTTGEGVTLTDAEQAEVIKTCLKVAKGRVPVLAGCGGNNTAAIIGKGKELKELGVTHILSVSPYYNKPTQEGIYQHYRAIRRETGLEIMLYSIQGRTASNVLPETVARLAEEKIIFAIKEGSGSIVQMQKICQLTGDSLQVFSGDDALTMPLMAVGGVGVVCTSSNVLPKPICEWVDTMKQGDFHRAQEQLKPLLPAFEAFFVETNPIPVKGAASLMGLMQARYRLPLVPPSESTMHLLKQVLAPFPRP